MLDTYKHKGLRAKLVQELRMKGIEDEAVLQAIATIPRHLFMESAADYWAYQDRSFHIGDGQTISQPYTVAVQTQLLEVGNREKVLEVGTGSGYQARVLEVIGCKVYSIERQKTLYLKTKRKLAEFNSLIRQFYGDGYKGLPDYAPFDRILVTCGAPEIPLQLLEQLKPGGIMVVPVGVSDQVMLKLRKREDGQVEVSEHGNFRFVPMLENKHDARGTLK